MHTIISNKIYVYGASLELYNYCANELIVNNPKWETLKKLGKEVEIKRYHIKPKMSLYVENGLDLIIPFGCLKAIWKFIQKGTYELRFNSPMPISCRYEQSTQELYPYQEKAVQEMVNAKGGVLIGGCGCGKTNIAIEIIRRIGLNALWLCHTKDLLVQSIRRIKSLYPHMHVGTITEGKVDMVKDGITVATIQTLANIDSDIYANNFGTIMTDEVHHVANSPTLQKYFAKVIEKIPARYKYGVSASDKRNDSLTKTIYTTIGCNNSNEYEPVYRIDRKDTHTLTARHEKVELDTPFSYEMLGDDGSFDFIKLVDYIANYEPRNETICKNIVELSKENRKQLVLCSRISQCEKIHNRLLELGIKSVLLVGKVSAKKRKEILTEQVDWKVIVATVSLAKEGLDVVSLDTLHLVSCLANKSDTVQSVGRIERVCENKKEPIAFDYVDVNIPYLVSKYKKRVNWLKKR